MRLEFHPEAELELSAAAAHYELRVPGLGQRFADEVRRVTDLLLLHPEIDTPIVPDLRRFVLRRFPFTLIYYLSQNRFESRQSLTSAVNLATGDIGLRADASCHATR